MRESKCKLLMAVACITLLLASVNSQAAEPGSADGTVKAKASKAVEYDKLPIAEISRMANAGNAQAQFELGSRFNYGRGIPKNIKQALVWLNAAAGKGHVEAQRLLALKYYYGYDVAIDHEQALLWTQRLADAGDLAGQMMLAAMFANGEGTPRNLIYAYAWYDIASVTAQQKTDRGDETARPVIVSAKDMRDQMGALLLPPEESAAQQFASDWWMKKMAMPAKRRAR